MLFTLALWFLCLFAVGPMVRADSSESGLDLDDLLGDLDENGLDLYDLIEILEAILGGSFSTTSTTSTTASGVVCNTDVSIAALDSSFRVVFSNGTTLDAAITEVESEDVTFFLSNFITAVTIETGGSEDAYLLTSPIAAGGYQRILSIDAEAIYDRAIGKESTLEAELEAIIPNTIAPLLSIVSDCNKALLGVTAEGLIYDLNIGSTSNDFVTPRLVATIGIGEVIAYNFDTGNVVGLSNNGNVSTLTTYTIGCPSTVLSTVTITPSGGCGAGNIGSFVYIGGGKYQVVCYADGSSSYAILDASGAIESTSLVPIDQTGTDVNVAGSITLDAEIDGTEYDIEGACEASDNADCVKTEDLSTCTL
mmetsp:Transcript_43019/g.71046  ORF Transcript_43019/g.71046 Transcript_43019/m.71046 type:complete len:365 (+) Transcript_43019:176-1270(+)